jgi:hypothetical protein
LVDGKAPFRPRTARPLRHARRLLAARRSATSRCKADESVGYQKASARRHNEDRPTTLAWSSWSKTISERRRNFRSTATIAPAARRSEIYPDARSLQWRTRLEFGESLCVSSPARAEHRRMSSASERGSPASWDVHANSRRYGRTTASAGREGAHPVSGERSPVNCERNQRCRQAAAGRSRC